MKYIKDLKTGERVTEIYLCKQKTPAVTKNGKPYENLILQDKTGTIDAKVWEPNSEGIEEYDALDYIDIHGDVSSFNGALQISVKRIRRCREGEFNPADYLPVSDRNPEEMFHELEAMIASVENRYLRQLLEDIFLHDEAFAARFKTSSAAKSVHHGFVGGLLEHTLSVARVCEFFCKNYPILKRDLLLTAALCHDIGKTKELSPFPENDYTDAGQLIGHIVIGTQMVDRAADNVDGFPKLLREELEHCILAHHGEFAYGSPKKPALIEALALNLADNTDAKMQSFKEVLMNLSTYSWSGYNRLFESNLRLTQIES